MAKKRREDVMVVENVLEVRHVASGTFLDVRGKVADYIRDNSFLPHWKIDTNVINFRDDPNRVISEGAFIGYKSAGFLMHDAKSRNHFVDRSSAFWKTLCEYDQYRLPELTRFGARTKVFIPSSIGFDGINRKIYETFFEESARNLIGGRETDLQFTIELNEGQFGVRLVVGPIARNEAGRYFEFESDHFSKCGLFLDIDFYKTKDLTPECVPGLLKAAIELTWQKAERIAAGLGI